MSSIAVNDGSANADGDANAEDLAASTTFGIRCGSSPGRYCPLDTASIMARIWRSTCSGMMAVDQSYEFRTLNQCGWKSPP